RRHIDAQGRECAAKWRKLVEPAAGPPVFDPHVAAFHVAKLAQPCEETFGIVHRFCPGAQKADHRHRGILRARGTRPERNATEKAKKMSPPHVAPAHGIVSTQTRGLIGAETATISAAGVRAHPLPAPLSARRSTSKITAVDQPISSTPFSAVIGPSRFQRLTGTTSPY